MRTVITGSGSFIPLQVKENSGFSENVFYDENSNQFEHCNTEIIKKFRQITGIAERRYADTSMLCSDMGALAAAEAITSSGIDAESIDQIIVAHNFADTSSNNLQADTVPSIAARIKHKLGIKNSYCVAYDILFGCPGWLQAIIQADAYIKAGVAKTCLVIGTETLSRVIDQHDRDSMIYSDGAGAAVVQMSNDENRGIIGSLSASYSGQEFDYIYMGKSNCMNNQAAGKFLKMQGRKVYEFALKYVPLAIKNCLDKSGINLHDVKKIFIHQANEKMDDAIVKRLFSLYNIAEVPAHIMPMNIQTLGNSSVATIPTLFDMVSKNILENHSLNKDDIIVFASVGAGMNINAVCYRM